MHLLRIKEQFTSLVDLKYKKGAEEHGGDLLDLDVIDLLDMAIDEAVDQAVYLLTIKNMYVDGQL